MKKRSYLLVLFVLGYILFYAVGFDMSELLQSSPTGAVTASYIEDQGAISVYFCPRENCTQALVDFLSSAEESIHCALFELDLEPLQDVLLHKRNVMDVKVITDNDYLYEFNHSFVKIDTWGLMHNKFCIIDGKKISTGSMNPTSNGAYKNNNNVVLVDSVHVARNYEDEFQEMWNGVYKKGSSVKSPSVKVGDTLVEMYFCPEDNCAEEVKDELKSAEESIHFMTFSFTSEEIANVLLLKHLDGVSISGVMEARGVTKHSEFARLQYNGVDVVKDKNKANMHHKVFIIDGKTVVTGSFNPTKSGDTRNDENLLIIHSSEIAQEYVEEFDLLR